MLGLFTQADAREVPRNEGGGDGVRARLQSNDFVEEDLKDFSRLISRSASGEALRSWYARFGTTESFKRLTEGPGFPARVVLQARV